MYMIKAPHFLPFCFILVLICFFVFVCLFLFIYLFIDFINFAKRPGSLTEQASPRVSEKKKDCDTTNKNENTLERTKKEMEMQKQNWGGHR